MKELQILDMDTLTACTKHFAIPAGDPKPSGGHVQVPNFALGPTVNPCGFVAASVTDGLVALVGLHPDMSCKSLGCNALIDNFDSTKGEIGCYGGNGHRRPPLGMVFLGR